MKRSNRREIARETLAILEKGSYISPGGKEISLKQFQQQAEGGTRVYAATELDPPLESHMPEDLGIQTEFQVVHATTLDATREVITAGIQDPMVLNFASAKNPGGGFLNGSQAQEESIARASGLYPCLLNGQTYYELHRKTRSCMYTDTMIYAPKVPIFKDEEGTLMEHMVCASILTSPAVNAGVVHRNEPDRIPEIEPIMRQRIAKVLLMGKLHQHHTLILGAWGCGVFRNDPVDIARYFRDAFDTSFNNQFEQVIFAVYSRNDRFIRPFIELFGE